MVEIDNKLNQKYRQQMDGIYAQDEEQQLCIIAQSYAICENAIAVLSNLRTDRSRIFFGRASELLGIAPTDSCQTIDSVWEEDIYNRIHPNDWKKRNLQELTFFRMVAAAHTKESFDWYLENCIRMRDTNGHYRYWRHRIFYFHSSNRRGISYALCLYNPTEEGSEAAYLINTLTGERKLLEVEDCRLLTDREKRVLQLIGSGKSSKMIADKLEISKHTVDRHRQNIIAKLQVNNTAEACHKAKKLGLIDN